MYFPIVVQNHTGIEKTLGIEQARDLPHQSVSFLAPFEFDEGRDVAPGAVLGLERAVVLLDDHVTKRIHETAITLDLGGIVEVLRKHEVQVSFERVSENNCVGIAVRRK